MYLKILACQPAIYRNRNSSIYWYYIDKSIMSIITLSFIIYFKYAIQFSVSYLKIEFQKMCTLKWIPKPMSR